MMFMFIASDRESEGPSVCDTQTQDITHLHRVVADNGFDSRVELCVCDGRAVYE